MKLVVALTVGLVKGVVGLFKKNETEVKDSRRMQKSPNRVCNGVTDLPANG